MYLSQENGVKSSSIRMLRSQNGTAGCRQTTQARFGTELSVLGPYLRLSRIQNTSRSENCTCRGA
jgi:hypothetical protein